MVLRQSWPDAIVWSQIQTALRVIPITTANQITAKILFLNGASPLRLPLSFRGEIESELHVCQSTHPAPHHGVAGCWIVRSYTEATDLCNLYEITGGRKRLAKPFTVLYQLIEECDFRVHQCQFRFNTRASPIKHCQGSTRQLMMQKTEIKLTSRSAVRRSESSTLHPDFRIS